MNLHEYQGKQLFAEYGLPVSQGYAVDTPEEAAAACDKIGELLSDETLALVVLDELNIALKYGYLALDEVLADIQARPLHQHVVVTGRGAPAELIEAADTVTEMGLVKHAFKAGVKAQRGVEY